MATAFGRDTPMLPEGPLAPPGHYRIRLSVGEKKLTQPLSLRMDPRVSTSTQDLLRQFEMETRIAAATEQTYVAFKQLEELRAQAKARLEEAKSAGGGSGGQGDALVAALQAFVRKAAALAGEKDSQETKPTFYLLNDQLADLFSVVDSADAAPTAQAQTGLEELQAQLASHMAAWQAFQRDDLPAVNAALRQAGLQPIELHAGATRNAAEGLLAQ
jgi:hypothetical protein